jgi:hypothetical protein
MTGFEDLVMIIAICQRMRLKDREKTIEVGNQSKKEIEKEEN